MSVCILERALSDGVVRLIQGDITEAITDAIVNAANSALMHGGGVAGAIARRGGPQIQAESSRIGFCAEGDAVVTGAGNLAARYVIHAVGPRGQDPDGDRKLGSAVAAAFARAEELGLTSITLPAISSGIFGFPKDRCARILLEQAQEHLSHPSGSLQEIDVCVFDEPTLRAFVAQWRALWPEAPGC